MKTHGQLVHVEEYNRAGVHYRIAVFRVQGGLHGQWSCDNCPTLDDDGVHPSIEECVADTKRFIEEHHREHHADRSSPRC
jgi:hypothetical protein